MVDYIRDKKSGALINTNKQGYLDAKSKKEYHLKMQERHNSQKQYINTLETKLNQLTKDFSALQDIVLSIIGDK